MGETAAPPAPPQRAARFLGAPGGLALATCLAVLPALATLDGGLVADDHVQFAMVRHRTRAAWNLFAFLSGDPAVTRARILQGELPWILSPDVKHLFFRPLASVTHWLDYRLWGALPAVAHLHNVLWLGVLAGSIAWVHRKIGGAGWVAPVAALTSLWSPAVAFSVGWLAGRNMLMATAFGSLALAAHHTWRAGGSRRWQGAATALLVLSLASSEAAVGTVALLVSYAAFLEAGPLPARARSIAPYALLSAAWWATELALGLGAAGSRVYADLGSGPWQLARAAAGHVPELLLLLLGQAHLSALHGFRLGAAPPPLLAGAALLVVLVGRRAVTCRVTRFWTLGALLATLPFAAMIPHVRLLASANVAWSMALVHALRGAHASAATGTAEHVLRKLELGALSAAVGLALGLGLACSIAPSRLGRAMLQVPPGLHEAEQASSRVLDRHAGCDIIVPIGDWLLAHSARLIQEERGVEPVRSVMTLAGSPDIRVDRPDERTLLVHAPRGMLGDEGRLLRASPFRAGEQVRTPRFTVEVLEASAALGPTELRYRFDGSLDDPGLAWLTDGGPIGLVPVAPPPVGYRATAPGAAPR